MADSDPLSQMFNLFAAPLAGAVQSFDQFRNGVEQFQRGVENFNRTMENLNETAERINVLLAEVEEPLRAAVPQVTRTVKTADEMMKVVSGPAIAVAPGSPGAGRDAQQPGAEADAESDGPDERGARRGHHSPCPARTARRVGRWAVRWAEAAGFRGTSPVGARSGRRPSPNRTTMSTTSQRP